MWQILTTFQVQDKPNLDSIFKPYLGYDLQGLNNSPNYFENL